MAEVELVRTRSRFFSSVFMLAVAALTTLSCEAAALLTVPAAHADDESCAKVDRTTTLCQRPGHSQLVTSPTILSTGPTYGFPYYGQGFGFGGLFLSLG